MTEVFPTMYLKLSDPLLLKTKLESEKKSNDKISDLINRLEDEDFFRDLNAADKKSI